MEEAEVGVEVGVEMEVEVVEMEVEGEAVVVGLYKHVQSSSGKTGG